ncbi:MAG TPA: sulfatase-like hydrolase/transferase [Thermoanaerobaculia bacterium]|nr:sulfatase-like hydrolase/transferase [Thermoanaerobaculia bacterium]
MLGALVGVIDSFLHENSSHLQIAPLEPLVFVLTWAICCCTTGVVFSYGGLRRLRWFPLAVAGPGFLLLSRGATPFKEMMGWPSSRVLLAWLAATTVIAILLSFIPLGKSRHTLAYGLAMLLGVGLLVYVAADVRIADWVSSPAAHAANARNVVLIFLDTTRADDALEAIPPAMPHLAAFAAKATTFSSAWAPASWTIPSHFAVFTGANWWRVPPDANGVFQYDGPRLPEQFQSRGYDTAAIFSNPLLSADAGFSKGFNEFTTSRRSGVCHSGIGELMFRVLMNGGPRMPLCSWFTASEVTSRALRYMKRAHRPYLLAVNYLDTHDPYYVPRECRPAGFEPLSRPDRDVFLTATPGGHQPAPSIVTRAHAQYRTAMSCADRSLGALLDAAAREPNTIVAVVGDHGEEFVEHGRTAHGADAYRESTHVPLVLRLPGVPRQRVTEPVITTDLYPSLLRAAKIFRGDEPLPLLDVRKRRPVVSIYEFARVPNDNSTVERGFSVVSGDYQLILWPGRGDVLYDYRHDPAEAYPLNDAAIPAIFAPMRQLAARVARDKQRALQFSAVGYMR